MPLTVATNKERRASLVSGGGLRPNTLQRRQRAAEDFDHFIQQSNICGVPLGMIMDYQYPTLQVSVLHPIQHSCCIGWYTDPPPGRVLP